MTKAGAVVGLLAFLGFLGVTFLFTAQASRGNGFALKLLKFFGLFLSSVPVFAILMYVIFRDRPSGYGERCGVMGLIGLGWYFVARLGGSFFVAP